MGKLWPEARANDFIFYCSSNFSHQGASVNRIDKGGGRRARMAGKVNKSLYNARSGQWTRSILAVRLTPVAMKPNDGVIEKMTKP